MNNNDMIKHCDNMLLICKAIGVFLACLFIITCVLLTKEADAFDADIYSGYYFDSTLRSNPNDDGQHAQWMAGLSIGHDWKSLRGYYNVETLMDQYNDDGTFHPASVKYRAGLIYSITKALTLEAEHMCWHPVDQGGRTEQYNLIKINYHFE